LTLSTSNSCGTTHPASARLLNARVRDVEHAIYLVSQEATWDTSRGSTTRVVPSFDERDVAGLLRLLGSQTDPEVPVSDEEADVLLRFGHLMRPPADEIAARMERILIRNHVDAP
jgi:hypothetical protein